MRNGLLVMFVAALVAFAVFVPTPTTHQLGVVVTADGSDPMPLCRDIKKCPILPPVVTASVVALPQTQDQCRVDQNGCKICHSSDGPRPPLCPPGVRPVNINEL